MAEVGDTFGAHDGGRYDNDFEKLPHDDDEVVSSTVSEPPPAPLIDLGTPGGDATDEAAALSSAAGKSQLNVDEPPPPATKPVPAAPATQPDVAITDKPAAACTSCESCLT